MSNYLNIQIPKGCTENWNGMLSQDKGRFCLSCQKKVTDFTQISDAELLRFFKEHHYQSLCGRFSAQQLNRDILIPSKKTSWVKYFLQFTLPAFLLSLKSSAQLQKTPIPIVEQMEKPGIKEDDMPISQTLTVEGIVQDETGKPLQGASVIVKSTQKGVVTDSAGKFIIKDVTQFSTLGMYYVGYTGKEIQVLSSQKKLIVQLSLADVMLGEVVVAGNFRVSRRAHKKASKAETNKPSLSPSLSVYPNPASNSSLLHLKCKSMVSGNYTAEIYNTFGALVQSEKTQLTEKAATIALSIKSLAAGNYFIKLVNEKNGKQLSQHFIVNY